MLVLCFYICTRGGSPTQRIASHHLLYYLKRKFSLEFPVALSWAVFSCHLFFSFYREYFFFCLVWNHGTTSCVKQIRSSVVFMCFFYSYALFSFGYAFSTFDYVIILFGYGLFSFDYVLFSFGYTLFCYAFPSFRNFCDSWCFRKEIL